MDVRVARVMEEDGIGAATIAALREAGVRIAGLSRGGGERVDYLVNNQTAGMDAAGWERLAGETEGLRAVVNVGFAGALRGDCPSAGLAASLGAVPAMTRYLARRLAPRVRVNAVLAGWIEDAPPEVAARTPMGRLARPEEVAEAILYLLAGNEFITGEILVVDGGWHL